MIARKSRKDGETLSQGQGPCTFCARSRSRALVKRFAASMPTNDVYVDVI